MKSEDLQSSQTFKRKTNRGASPTSVMKILRSYEQKDRDNSENSNRENSTPYNMFGMNSKRVENESMESSSN